MDTAQKIVCDLISHHMTDSDIADKVNSSQPTIWRIRTGKTKSCSSELYRALCELRDSVFMKNRRTSKQNRGRRAAKSQQVASEQKNRPSK